MTARYELWIKNTDRERIAVVSDGKDSIWRSLYFVHIENAPGLCRFELDAGSAAAEAIGYDYEIVIRRRYAEFGIDWYTEWHGFITTIEREVLENGQEKVVFWATGLLDLIRRRWIWYLAGSAFTDKSGVGETVIKEFVDENAGPGASNASRIESGVTPDLVVEADGARGGAWEGARAFRDLLDVVKDVALASGLAIDVVDTAADTGGDFEFRVYEGQRGEDRSTDGLAGGLNSAGNVPVTFSLAAGNMAKPSYAINHSDEYNAILVMGQGREAGRNYVVVSDAAAIAASPRARRELVRNASQESTDDGLTSAGEAALEESQAQERFGFEVLQQSRQAYGLHYWFGDLITAGYHGVITNKRIAQVKVTVDPQDGGENIVIDFADVVPFNLKNPQQKMGHQITGLDKRVKAIEARDPAPDSTVGTVAAESTVGNTGAETTSWSETIRGGTVGTDGWYRLILWVQYLNNSGAARTFTVKLKYGGTTVCTLDNNGATIAASATRRIGKYEFLFKGNAAVNAQKAVGFQALRQGATDLVDEDSGTAAIDSTADQTLLITFQHSTNNVNLTATVLGVSLEKVDR